MLQTCRIHLCKMGRGSDFFKKSILSENIFFAIDYQGNATICLLQPKILDRNYSSTNNRYNIFIRLITVNSTVHHLCKNLYVKYSMQYKLSNFYFLNIDSIRFVDIKEVFF